MEDAIKEATEKAVEETEEKRSVEIAKNLLKLNISVSDISKATGLTKEEIEKLVID